MARTLNEESTHSHHPLQFNGFVFLQQPRWFFSTSIALLCVCVFPLIYHRNSKDSRVLLWDRHYHFICFVSLMWHVSALITFCIWLVYRSFTLTFAFGDKYICIKVLIKCRVRERKKMWRDNDWVEFRALCHLTKKSGSISQTNTVCFILFVFTWFEWMQWTSFMNWFVFCLKIVFYVKQFDAAIKCVIWLWQRLHTRFVSGYHWNHCVA